MKKPAMILTILLLAAGCAHQNPSPAFLQQVGGEQLILGEVQYREILRHFPAWKAAHRRSQANPALVEQVRKISEPLEVLCYFGSWCEDSRGALPVFIKTLTAAGNARITVKLIGVDRQKDDPAHSARQRGIALVPTFIVLRNGEEIARMIEFPRKENFVEDLLDILQAP